MRAVCRRANWQSPRSTYHDIGIASPNHTIRLLCFFNNGNHNISHSWCGLMNRNRESPMSLPVGLCEEASHLLLQSPHKASLQILVLRRHQPTAWQCDFSSPWHFSWCFWIRTPSTLPHQPLIFMGNFFPVRGPLLDSQGGGGTGVGPFLK